MSIEYSVYGDAEKRLKDDFFNTTISSPTNDLIFTKPDAVKLVLDAIERNNPNAFNSVTKTYCDIASKSGAFLIGIAERIFNSEEAKRLFPNPYKRIRHIYQYQIFALTSNLMCWWTIYQRIYRIYDRESKKEIIEPFCKQNVLNVERLNYVANFNEEEVLEMFRKQSNFSKEVTVNDWDEIEVTDASSDRKFDYIISNPPYQVSKGGTKNVDIWYHFDEKATKIADKVCMIHPGRWVVPKKNMVKVRDMLIDCGLEYFDYYEDSSTIFPTTRINGSTTICQFNSVNPTTEIMFSVDGGEIKEYAKDDIVFTSNNEEEIYNAFNGGKYDSIEDRILGSVGSLGMSEFGYDKDIHRDLLNVSPEGMENPIKVWATKTMGKGARYQWFYADKSELFSVPDEITSTRKIMISKVGTHESNYKNGFNGEAQICEKNATGINVFFAIPKIDNDYHLNLIKSYFETKTVRFLMSITQKDIYVRGFENVPDYTYFIDELNGELFTDEFFYKKFNFSEEVINHIETYIKAK